MRTVSKMMEEIDGLQKVEEDEVVRGFLNHMNMELQAKVWSGAIDDTKPLNVNDLRVFVLEEFQRTMSSQHNNVFKSKSAMKYLTELMETNREGVENLVRNGSGVRNIYRSDNTFGRIPQRLAGKAASAAENRQEAVAVIQDILNASSSKESKGLQGMRNAKSSDNLELLQLWQDVVTKRLKSPFMGEGGLFTKKRDNLNSRLYNTIKNLNVENPSVTSLSALKDIVDEMKNAKILQEVASGVSAKENKKRS